MAEKLPWSKFFWSDWENDVELRLCSLAAQGLWMRMLCIAAKADPCGVVTVNGKPVTASILSRLTGEPEPVVEALLAELSDNGVFAVDAKGRIYSRRLVREARNRAESIKHGKSGGNPNLCKDSGFSRGVNPPLKPPDNPPLKSKKLEAEAEADNKSCRKRKRISYSQSFEDFWKAYPTDPLMSKSEANKSWLRLPEEDHEKAMLGIAALREHCSANPDYRCVHAAVYLNQRRFDGLSEKAQQLQKQNARIPVIENSKPWVEWMKYRGKPFPVTDIQTQDGRRVRGWYAESLYPPNHNQLQAAE